MTSGRAEQQPPPDITAAVDSIRRIVRGLRLAGQRTRSAVGLSAAQLFVLAQLERGAATSIGALAEQTLTDRSSAAAVVERLEDAGLVVTARSPEDRRRIVVRITERGRQRLRAAPPAPTQLLIRGLKRLPDHELRTLSTHLARLVDAMGLSGEPATMLFEERDVLRPGGRDGE